jgi:DNA-binding NarL/FixJ family response regulator
MTTALIVADVRIHRHGYRSLLTGEDGIEFLGVCSPEDAPKSVLAQRPDVVLLDVTTGGHPSVIDSILAFSPQAKVIAFGVEAEESAIFAWIARGAVHVVSNLADEVDLLSAIREVTSSEFHYSPTIISALREGVRSLIKTGDAPKADVHLTPRERQIVQLLRQDYSNKEIAVELSIAVSSVKNHVHHILEKNNVHRRAKAVAGFDKQIADQNCRPKI